MDKDIVNGVNSTFNPLFITYTKMLAIRRRAVREQAIAFLTSGLELAPEGHLRRRPLPKSAQAVRDEIFCAGVWLTIGYGIPVADARPLLAEYVEWLGERLANQPHGVFDEPLAALLAADQIDQLCALERAAATPIGHLPQIWPGVAVDLTDLDRRVAHAEDMDRLARQLEADERRRRAAAFVRRYPDATPTEVMLAVHNIRLVRPPSPSELAARAARERTASDAQVAREAVAGMVLSLWQPRPAARADCGHDRRFFEPRDHQRTAFIARRRCGRHSCPACHARIVTRQIWHATACFLHLVIDQIPRPQPPRRHYPGSENSPQAAIPMPPTDADGKLLPLRETVLYVWEGPNTCWTRVRQRIRRAGREESICRPGYGRAETLDRRGLRVVSEVAFKDAMPVSPAEAAQRFAAWAVESPSRKGGIVWGGRWTPARREPRYYERHVLVSMAEAERIIRSHGAQVDCYPPPPPGAADFRSFENMLTFRMRQNASEEVWRRLRVALNEGIDEDEDEDESGGFPPRRRRNADFAWGFG
jgi:hypothetical protein